MVSRFFRQAGDSDSDTESSDEESLTSGDEAQKPATSAQTKPKSRFLRSGGSSDSESSSEEEESDSSEDEQKPTAPAHRVSKYLAAGSDDEDSDEDVKRVVKSAKDKRLDEMEATGNSMNNALKINDWTAISSGGFVPPLLSSRIMTPPRV
jgi:translation initiation factor 3 subunit C